MKRLRLFAIVILLLSLPVIASANMAVPTKADIGSGITFEKNDTLSVISEVLDITVKGSEAQIHAVYKMKNTAENAVTTKSMFLASYIEESTAEVTVNGSPAAFTVEKYSLNYSTSVKTEDWRYAVLNEHEDDYEGKTVEAISFEMSFEPLEEYEVSVSYKYCLGGYPELDYSAKYGKIEYYLAPAAMWKDFSSLTINLTLDDDMPIIKDSNLTFKKTGRLTYVFQSETLPAENLSIRIDENAWQEIVGSFKSPYIVYTLLMASPFVLLALLILVVVLLFVRKAAKNKKQAK